MKIRFEVYSEIKKLVDDIEMSCNVKGLSGWQKTIYRTAKGLEKALREENKRTSQLFQPKEDDEVERLAKLGEIKRIFERLAKIREFLHRLDENACNYGLTPRQEKRAEKLEKEAQELAEKLDANIYHQGDPRGWTLYLVSKYEKEPHLNYYRGIPV